MSMHSSVFVLFCVRYDIIASLKNHDNSSDKGCVDLNESCIISTDEDPSLWIQSFEIASKFTWSFRKTCCSPYENLRRNYNCLFLSCFGA